jgi:6-phosphogluconate dehydrogenase
VKNNDAFKIGFIGLGVMGSNLVLNLADNGFFVVCYDVDSDKVKQIELVDQQQRGHQPKRVHGCSSITDLLTYLADLKTIMISVPAGDAVDEVCKQLIAHGIETKDIVIDTGNSLWTDTIAREQLYQNDFVFFSTAVSGGEVGARFGPSLMPSGSLQAWQKIAPIFKAIAAKVDPNTGRPIERFEPGNPVIEGEPCADYIGPAGSGHYVKMVHNGIEYADMQLICEGYHILREGLGFSVLEIADIFECWNTDVLDSYLMGISIEVLRQQDPATKQPLIDIILDCAGQKGTGLWTAVSALQMGSPAQTITQAVFARSISSLKSERVRASKILKGPEQLVLSDADKQRAVDELKDALYCSKICAYAQGFQLMSIASKEQGWSLDFSAIAKIWRAGCIIRAVFLQDINSAYLKNDSLENLLLDPFFAGKINELQMSWRHSIANAVVLGIPHPAMSSALAYYDAYRCELLPANLLQAQRDFFGAHTFSRVDKPEHEKYHLDWSAKPRVLKKLTTN